MKPTNTLAAAASQRIVNFINEGSTAKCARQIIGTGPVVELTREFGGAEVALMHDLADGDERHGRPDNHEGGPLFIAA